MVLWVCGVVLIVVVVCSWGVRVVSVLVDDGALSSGIAGLRGAVSDLSRAFAPDCSGVGDPSVVGSCAALVACLESSRVSLADRADALRGYLGTVRDSTDALDARLAGSADGIAGTAPLAGPAGPLDGLVYRMEAAGQPGGGRWHSQERRAPVRGHHHRPVRE